MRCPECRAVGAIHCANPENCGGPWDKHSNTKLLELENKRDILVFELWNVLHKMCDYMEPEHFTDEDAELFCLTASHSSIQSRLEDNK